MEQEKKDNDFYSRFRQQLIETSAWPGPYVFKFIVPSNGTAQQVLNQLFENDNVTTTVRASSKGKYTSISIDGTFQNPDVIIEKYQQAAKIPNIIQL